MDYTVRFEPATYQQVIGLDIYKYYLDKAKLFSSTASEDRRRRLTRTFREFKQSIPPNSRLFKSKGIPIVVGIQQRRAGREFVLTQHICNLNRFELIVLPQRYAHLFEILLDFQWLERRLNELFDSWQNVFLPVLEQFVLFDLWWEGIDHRQVCRWRQEVRTDCLNLVLKCLDLFLFYWGNQ